MAVKIADTLVDVDKFAAFRMYEMTGRYRPCDAGWYVEGLTDGSCSFVMLAGPFDEGQAKEKMQDLATEKVRLELARPK